jgi:hypothetical protein
MVRCLVLLAFALGGVVPASANIVECGGNSFSWAEVRSRPKGEARRAPLVAMPDSLCADLVEEPRRRIESLDIVIDPRGEPQNPAVPPRSRNPGRVP